MTLRELFNKIERVREGTMHGSYELELVIEDFAGTEYVVDKVYFFEPAGIGIDIKERYGRNQA